MTQTDYTEGDGPVPVGAVIEYFGSHAPGRYEIIEHHNDLTKHPTMGSIPAGYLLTAYPDGVAYDIWPVGVPKKFGNRDRAVYWVRRTSFRIVRN